MNFRTELEQALRDGGAIRTQREFGSALKNTVIDLWNEGASQDALLEAMEEFRTVVPSEDYEDIVLDMMDLVYDLADSR